MATTQRETSPGTGQSPRSREHSPPMLGAQLTIAEAAREAGVSAHTLRYYERAGLLAPIERNGSGHRRFTPEDLEWITVCTKLRATGMPIRRIREYAELVRDGDGNEAARLDLLKAHREDVLAHMAEVERNLELIDYKIRLYRDCVGTD